MYVALCELFEFTFHFCFYWFNFYFLLLMILSLSLSFSLTLYSFCQCEINKFCWFWVAALTTNALYVSVCALYVEDNIEKGKNNEEKERNENLGCWQRSNTMETCDFFYVIFFALKINVHTIAHLIEINFKLKRILLF